MDEMLYTLLRDCTVRIKTMTRYSTGCFVSPGLVLTVSHAIPLGDEPFDGIIEWRDQAFTATIQKRFSYRESRDEDLMLLRLDAEDLQHPCIYLHDSVRPGDILYSFGHSNIYQGGASALYKCEGFAYKPKVIKFSGGRVELGLDGSPLLNERTQGVCGIIIYTHDQKSSMGGGAVPTSTILSLIPELKEQQIRYHEKHDQWVRLMRRSRLDGHTITISNVVIPNGYNKLIEPLEAFFNDFENSCNEYSKNVFIMTRFQSGNETLSTIDSTIRSVLNSWGMSAHRADDKTYPSDRNLWDSVCTYMIGCKYGIAVLEDILRDEFNPNVALEYGFMRALGKPTLLLKERRMEPRADILGTLWEPFDILDIETTITQSVNRWLSDIEI